MVRRFALLAQLVEQLPLKEMVGGSIPSRGTKLGNVLTFRRREYNGGMGYEMKNFNNDKQTLDLQAQAELVKRNKFIDDINRIYPNAKINPASITGNSVEGYTLNGRPVEEYALLYDQAYDGPNDNKEIFSHN
jgi:hypothetical protein